jgi:23S rRNA-/tRNA-specific pseudouridylate synthase
MDLDIKTIIVYEDNNFLIVNKPRGLLLQQDGDFSHPSLDIIISNYLGKTAMPVHRLDKDTSGICVFAKNNKAADEMGKIFKDHS